MTTRAHVPETEPAPGLVDAVVKALGVLELVDRRFGPDYVRSPYPHHEVMRRAAVSAVGAVQAFARDRGRVAVSQELLAAYEQMLGAVEGLLDRCERISPNAIVATSLVRTALTTGQVPDLPTRYPDGGQHDEEFAR